MEYVLGLSVAALAAVLAIVAIRKNGQTMAEQEAVEAARVMTLHAAGLVDENGRPICIVDGCKLLAEKPDLMIDKPARDKRWPRNWLDQLYEMPMRYSTANKSETPEICVKHHRMGQDKCERFNSKARAKHADFNADMMDQVEVFNNGGLLKLLAAGDKRTKEALDIADHQLLGARSYSEDGTVALPAKSSGSEEKV